MHILVPRYNSAKDHTNSVIIINGVYECFGLEDEFRTEKVYGETRIPDGIYPIEFRKVGGFHARYLKKFGPEFHDGMLWIKDVPNFTYVLIHIGNDDDDTAACLITGQSNSKGANWVGASTPAYKALYIKVRDALLRNECVNIEFTTLDNKYRHNEQ